MIKKALLFCVFVLQLATNTSRLFCMEADFQEENRAASLKQIAAKAILASALISEDVQLTRNQISRLPSDLEFYLQEQILNGPSRRSLLHNASSEREILQLLKGFWIDPLVCTKEDETPLMTFLRDGKRAQALTFIDYLREAGMAFDQKDMYGKTALDLAELFGDTELEDVLKGISDSREKEKNAFYAKSILENSTNALKKFFTAKNVIQDDLIPVAFAHYVELPTWMDGGMFLKSLPKGLSFKALAQEAAKEDIYTGLTFMHKITNPEQVRLLVAIGANFNKISKEGQNSLHYMIKTGNFDAAGALLQSSQMVNFDACDAKGMTPLGYAIIAQNEALIRMLLEKGANSVNLFTLNRCKCNPWLLFLRPKFYKKELVRLLFAPEVVAKVDAFEKMNALIPAIKNQYKEVISALLGNDDFNTLNYNGTTLAMRLAKTNHKRTLNSILKSIKDVNQVDNDGHTALFYSLTNKARIIKCILKNGVNSNHQDNDGKTALHFAAQKPGEALALLLDHDSLIDVRDNQGRTPLLQAVEAGMNEHAEMLINRGADINIVNNQGQSALHIALEKSNECIAKKLIEHGTNVNVQDFQGISPLMICKKNNLLEITELLMHKMNDSNVKM